MCSSDLGDFFSWYLSAWDAALEDALRRTLGRLAEYNPVTVHDDPHSARDLLKKLYHYLCRARSATTWANSTPPTGWPGGY